MVTKIILIILIVLIIPLALAIGTFMQNRLPWMDTPGFSKRLRTYLTTNIAETSIDPEHPELLMRDYPLQQDSILPIVEKAMLSLGWDILVSNKTKQSIHAVVTTTLWRFKDDVIVTLQPVAGNDRTRVGVRASARVGRGDFGTNTRHILNLYSTIENEIKGY
jgi:uncharacterized protein (DUF1499 family)